MSFTGERFRIAERVVAVLVLTIIFSCERRDFKISAKADTGAVTEIRAATAKVTGNLVDLGEGVSDYGHCWTFTSQPTIQNYKTSFGKADNLSAVVSVMENLEPGKIYHVRSYVISGTEVIYGDDVQFTTQSGQAVLTTSNVTDITATSANCGGNITSDGGDPITERGVCWSLTQNPTTSNFKTSNGTGTGSFVSSLTNLTMGSTYYVRAYAINSIGVSYGNIVECNTLSGLPLLSTNNVTNILSHSATSGGNITSEGSAPITERGICWNTTQNPTVSNFKTNDGSGVGTFTSVMTNLIPGTTYFVRAYANNSYGINYGSEINFTTLNEIPQNGLVAYYPFSNGSTSDLSGNLNNGVNNGTTPATDRFGNDNDALFFNAGNNAYVNCGNGNSLQMSQNITVCIWIKSSSLFGVFKSILEKYDYPTNKGWELETRGSLDGRIFWCVPGVVILGSQYVNDYNWHFIVGQRDGSAFRIFTDGLLTAEVINNTAGSMINNGNLIIGYQFTGLIDDIRIYDRSLNLGEISAIYHEGGWK